MRYVTPLLIGLALMALSFPANSAGGWSIQNVEVTPTGGGSRKCSIEVLLTEPVWEDRLSDIARQVEAFRCSGIRPLFFGYRLLSDPPATGFFASTHFNPDLIVVIYRNQ